VKFTVSVEVDSKELSDLLNTAGAGAVQAVLANPQVMDLVAQIAPLVGAQGGPFAAGARAGGAAAVTQLRRRAPVPWASPEARAAAEAAGPPVVSVAPGGRPLVGCAVCGEADPSRRGGRCRKVPGSNHVWVDDIPQGPAGAAPPPGPPPAPGGPPPPPPPAGTSTTAN
jgi:hypothetical protein